MKNIDRNASASAFGWQFQIDMGIYLMLKYFNKFSSLKLEGESEDIELTLNNKKKIYAQAKSKQNVNDSDHSSYSTKLCEALDSLSDVDSSCAELLIYISNLEPNPLNSGTKEFDYACTFLKYSELSAKSQKKIDNQLIKLNKKIDKDKLLIAKVPFFGEDEYQKQKFVIEQIEKFLSFVSSDMISFKYEFLKNLESKALNNASTKEQSHKILKDDILWDLVVIRLGDKSSLHYSNFNNINEEDFYEAIEKYEDIINFKSSNFKVYNHIVNLISKAKMTNKDIKSEEFINIYDDEIYNIVFDNKEKSSNELIERVCSRIVAKKIFIRKKTIEDLFERVSSYDN